MSYRPKYKNDDHYSDLPIDAETVAGHAVENSGVDSNTSTLPTTAQVKAYVDPKINANAERITALEGAMLSKVDKSDIGYIEISSNEGTLTAEQLLEVNKKYCIIKYTDSDSEEHYYYKCNVTNFATLFAGETIFTSNNTGVLNLTHDVFFVMLASGEYNEFTYEAQTYQNTKIDTLLNAKINISDIIDTLISTATNKPLSANQGKVLKDLIDACISKDGSGNIAEVLHLVNGIASKEDEDYPMQSSIKLGSGTRTSSVDILADGEESGARIRLHGTSSPDSCGTAQIYGDLSINSKTRPIVYEDGVQKQLAYLSDTSHLYEHNIILADSSDMTAAQNYVTFTILSSSNTAFSTLYAIANKLIGDGITDIKYAKKASGRCDTDSSKFIVDVDFSNQETEESYIETSVVGVYAWDDDPAQLKIVYSQLDERGANCIKATNAPSTYVQDTVVQIY